MTRDEGNRRAKNTLAGADMRSKHVCDLNAGTGARSFDGTKGLALFFGPDFSNWRARIEKLRSNWTGRLDFGYGAPANNSGNLLSQVITVGATSLTQSYGYDDPLNRLSVASEAGNWSQTYQYDRHGNRWVTPSSYILAAALTPQALSHFDSSNNRLVGSDYDLAGNLTTGCHEPDLHL